MLFKKEVLRDSVLCENDNPEEDIEFIESSGWHDEGKWSWNEYIFKHGGKFYSVTDQRSGSYYSDYYYESREEWSEKVNCEEVEKVPVTTYEWKAV